MNNKLKVGQSLITCYTVSVRICRLYHNVKIKIEKFLLAKSKDFNSCRFVNLVTDKYIRKLHDVPTTVK